MNELSFEQIKELIGMLFFCVACLVAITIITFRTFK